MSEQILFKGADSVKSTRIVGSLEVLCSYAKTKEQLLPLAVIRTIVRSIFPEIPTLFEEETPQLFFEGGTGEVRWRLVKIQEERELPPEVFGYLLSLKRYVSART